MIKSKHLRVVLLYCGTLCMLLLLFMRILILNGGTAGEAAAGNRTRILYENEVRGTIYDCNGKPMVNNQSKKIYAVLPSYAVLLAQETMTEALAPLRKGLPVLTEENPVSLFGSENVLELQHTERNSENQNAAHLIGYTNAAGNGVCGIERAYDTLLRENTGMLQVSYESGADGTALAGTSFRVTDTVENSKAGVVLTLDKQVQKQAEKLLKEYEIDRGALVVLDMDDCAILAMASSPVFSPCAPEESLGSDALPFLNRALCAWPVGSVFKPLIAAAALENGVDCSQPYMCTGKETVDANSFHCFQGTAHGEVTLAAALAQSCNAYFIHIGLSAGREAICQTSKAFGLGSPITLADGIVSEGGNIPAAASLQSDADVANLSFGQGTLLATPLQIAAAYAAIGNEGIYQEPYLVKKIVNRDGLAIMEYCNETARTVIQKKTALQLSEYLYRGMLNGIAAAGLPESVSAAGKTATAQTGSYAASGKEKLITWFAGYLPYENPQYAVVILKENGSTASRDCAPVFRALAEYLYANGFIF